MVVDDGSDSSEGERDEGEGEQPVGLPGGIEEEGEGQEEVGER